MRMTLGVHQQKIDSSQGFFIYVTKDMDWISAFVEVDPDSTKTGFEIPFLDSWCRILGFWMLRIGHHPEKEIGSTTDASISETICTEVCSPISQSGMLLPKSSFFEQSFDPIKKTPYKIPLNHHRIPSCSFI